MESCPQNDLLGSRPRGGNPRGEGRGDAGGPHPACRAGPDHGTGGSQNNSATGSSRCGCGSAKLTSVGGHEPGGTSDESARMRELKHEVRELCRANVVLKRAASFFGAELNRKYRR